MDVERQIEFDGQVDEQREDLPLNRQVALVAHLPAVEADLADGRQARTFPADQARDLLRFHRIEMGRIEAGGRSHDPGMGLSQFEVPLRVRSRLADRDDRVDAGVAGPCKHVAEVACERAVAEVGVAVGKARQPGRNAHQPAGSPTPAPRRSSSSSTVLGQSFFSKRERARSASSRPPVWQRAQ